MKKRPLSIYILTALHLLAPLFTVISSRLIKNQSLAIDTLFTMESVAANWPGYILPIIGALCIYLCKKWSMVAYLITMTALFIISFINFQSEASGGSLALLTLVWAVNISVVIYFLRPALRQIYTDPKIRWWEQSQRYNSSLDAIFNFDEMQGEGEIINISKTGLLLKTDSPLNDNNQIDVKIKLSPDEFISLSGQVIKHKQITQGFGVKFDKSSTNKKSAKQIINTLKT